MAIVLTLNECKMNSIYALVYRVSLYSLHLLARRQIVFTGHKKLYFAKTDWHA